VVITSKHICGLSLRLTSEQEVRIEDKAASNKEMYIAAFRNFITFTKL